MGKNSIETKSHDEVEKSLTSDAEPDPLAVKVDEANDPQKEINNYLNLMFYRGAKLAVTITEYNMIKLKYTLYKLVGAELKIIDDVIEQTFFNIKEEIKEEIKGIGYEANL